MQQQSSSGQLDVEQLADTVERILLGVACEEYRGLVEDKVSFDQWTNSVRGRLALLRSRKRKEGEAEEADGRLSMWGCCYGDAAEKKVIAPLSVALRRAWSRHQKCSSDVYEIEAINHREASNSALLSYFVLQQRQNLTAEAAEALEIESRASLNHYYIKALSHYHSLREELSSENTNIKLNDWQKNVLEDWRSVLLRHCGAYGSLPASAHHRIVNNGEEDEDGQGLNVSSPDSLPPPNPNFTIWSSSPDQLSPSSNRSGSLSSSTNRQRTSSPPPPQPPLPPANIQPTVSHITTEVKKRRLTLNLDVARIHYDVDQYDKVMGGAAGAKVPNFGAAVSELPPSFRPQMPPSSAVAADAPGGGGVISLSGSTFTAGNGGSFLQVPGANTHVDATKGQNANHTRTTVVNRQRSPQEAEQPAPFRGFNFGFPPPPPPPTASMVPAFNPQQGDLSSQLTFRAPPPVVSTQNHSTKSPSSKVEEAAGGRPGGRSNVRAANAAANQKKKRLSLTAKAARAQERSSDLPQWWD